MYLLHRKVLSESKLDRTRYVFEVWNFATCRIATIEKELCNEAGQWQFGGYGVDLPLLVWKKLTEPNLLLRYATMLSKLERGEMDDAVCSAGTTPEGTLVLEVEKLVDEVFYEKNDIRFVIFIGTFDQRPTALISEQYFYDGSWWSTQKKYIMSI